MTNLTQVILLSLQFYIPQIIINQPLKPSAIDSLLQSTDSNL